MPNFHDNNLVIVADEGDMKKVLTRLAMNLSANGEETGFDIRDIDGLDTVEEIYREVGPVVDGRYDCAFAGAPVPVDVAAGVRPGWTSPTSSEAGLLGILGTLDAALGLSGGDASGGDGSWATTLPTGRPASDTADVGLRRYGETWVLSIDYDTAWCPNSEDLDLFFMGLPAGDYGVAFFDADEGERYDRVSVFAGLHHGRAPMHGVEDGGGEDVVDRTELRGRARACASLPKAGIADLAELAELIALRGWDFERGHEDDEDDDEDGGGDAAASLPPHVLESTPGRVWSSGRR